MDKLFKFYQMLSSEYDSFGDYLTDQGIGYELVTNITDVNLLEYSIVVVYDEFDILDPEEVNSETGVQIIRVTANYGEFTPLE